MSTLNRDLLDSTIKENGLDGNSTSNDSTNDANTTVADTNHTDDNVTVGTSSVNQNNNQNDDHDSDSTAKTPTESPANEGNLEPDADSEISENIDSKRRKSESGTSCPDSSGASDVKRSHRRKKGKRSSDDVPQDLHITSKMKHFRSLQIMADTVTTADSKYPHNIDVLNGRFIRFVHQKKERVILAVHANGLICAAYASFHSQPERPVAIKLFYKKRVDFDCMFLEASVLSYAGANNAPVPTCYGVVPFTTSSECKFLSAGIVISSITEENSLRVTTLKELRIQSIPEEFLEEKTPGNIPYKPLTQLAWRQLMSDLVAAVGVLHNNGVIMNTLMQDTLLVKRDNSGRWKPYIVDFYLARVIDDVVGMDMYYDLTDWESSYHYMAPEMFECHVLCSWHQDIYSLGIIMQAIGWDLNMGKIIDLGTVCSAMDPQQRFTIAQLKKCLSILRYNG